MIYTRLGSKVEIVSYYGKHAIGQGLEGNLLKVGITPVDSDEETFYRFRFAESLKADNGYNEIMRIVKRMKVSKLSSDELKEAIQEAL